MASKDNFVLEISSTGESRVEKIKITALRAVTLYELSEALYEHVQTKEANISFEIEYCSCDGKTTYHFNDHAYWINPITVLSDISQQIQI